MNCVPAGNRSNTALSLFRQAVNECSWSSRVRSDKGGENVDVARVMLGVRGTGLRCHIAGSSVAVEGCLLLCVPLLLLNVLRDGKSWYSRPNKRS